MMSISATVLPYAIKSYIAFQRQSRTSTYQFSFPLQHFANDLGGLLVGAEQLFALLPLRLDRVVFVKEILEELFLVQLADQSILDDIFAVVDEQVHHCLWHLICDHLPDDVEVRADEAPNKLGLKGFPFCQRWGICL